MDTTKHKIKRENGNEKWLRDNGKCSRWSIIILHGSKLSERIWNGVKWSKMAPNDWRLLEVVLNGSQILANAILPKWALWYIEIWVMVKFWPADLKLGLWKKIFFYVCTQKRPHIEIQNNSQNMFRFSHGQRR